jgi:inner membrane protein
MFIFAHIGITIAGSSLVSGSINIIKSSSNTQAHDSPNKTSPPKKAPFSELIGLNSLSRFVDLRLLMIGSMMPDIIDKPLALCGFGNGRSITHTLLISLVVLCMGFFLYLYHKRTWSFAIAIGILSHLILDSMWATPQTLFWPLYGWSFPSPVTRLSFQQVTLWWNALKTNPGVYISEGIGLAILLGAALIIVGQKGLKSFSIKGKM